MPLQTKPLQGLATSVSVPWSSEPLSSLPTGKTGRRSPETTLEGEGPLSPATQPSSPRFRHASQATWLLQIAQLTANTTDRP